MPEVAKLHVTVGVNNDPLKKGMAQGRDEMGRFAKSASGLGAVAEQALGVFSGNLLTSALNGVMSLGKQAVQSASELQAAVANISTIKPEIDTSQVFDALNEMQLRVPQSSKELGEALYDVFSSMNVTQKDGLKLVEEFARGAVGAQTDAKTFGTAVMGVMNAYKLSVKDAAHVSDLFFNTVNAGVVSGPELANSLGPVIQSAKAAGVSVNEAFALIAASTKEGGPAAQNINNVNNLLQKITTTDAQKALKDLGVQASDKGKFRPILDVLTDLKGKISGLSQTDAAQALQKIFPDAQARQGAQTLLSQLDFAKQALDDNANKAGAARKAYETMSQTFAAQSAIASKAVTAFGTMLGSFLLPMITPLLVAFNAQLPGAIEATKAAFTAFGQVAPAMIEGFLTDLLGVPVQFDVIVAAAKQFVQGVVGFFRDNFPAIRATVAQVFEGVMTVVRPVSRFIVQQLAVVIDWVKANYPLIAQTVRTVLRFIQEFWRDHGAQIMAVIRPLWNIITTVISGAVKVILDLLKLVMQVINGDWRGAWNTLGSIIKTVFSTVVSIIGNAFSYIGAVLKAIPSLVGEVWKRIGAAALGIGKAIVEGLLGGIRAGFGAIGNAASELANHALTAMRNRLGVKSPARETKKIGEYTVEGFLLGLASGQPHMAAAYSAMLQNAMSFNKVYLKQLEDSRKKASDIIRAATRDVLVAKYGDKSAPVLAFDNPLLGSGGARDLAATLQRLGEMKQKADAAAEASRNLATEFIKFLFAVPQADESVKGIIDLIHTQRLEMLKLTETTEEQRASIDIFKQSWDSLTAAQKRYLNEYLNNARVLRGTNGLGDTLGGFLNLPTPESIAAMKKSIADAANATTNQMPKGSPNEIGQSATGTGPDPVAESKAKAFVQTVRDGVGNLVGDMFNSGRSRDALRRFTESLRQSVTSLLSDALTGLVKSSLTGTFEGLLSDFKGDLKSVMSSLGNLLSGIESSVGRMISNTYALLAASGARGKKQQNGALFGALAAIVAAPFTGGASLAYLGLASTAGAFLADPGVDTGVALGSGLYGSGVVGGKKGGKSRGAATPSGDGTTIINNNNFYGPINNQGDADAQGNRIAAATRRGLKTSRTGKF